MVTQRRAAPLSSLRLEAVVLALLLGLALFLRLWQLEAAPPGLHYDEAIDLKQGLLVAQGARPLYVAEGWGREALYYYLVAVVLQLVPDNLLALRLSAVLCGMGLLLLTYLLVRRWHSPLAAWLTVAWLGLTYWPLSASRFGVRHISLPLMLGLLVLLFGWAWEGQQRREGRLPGRSGRFILAGICLGATLYTYQPARFVPLIFAVFTAYLFVWHRPLLRARARELGLFALAGLITALPLAWTLADNWGAEAEQRAFTIEPLVQLLEGDPRAVVANSLATLKVFTVSGDPLESYNVPDRPIFVPAWTGLFFYIGLAGALRRWRRPVYAFALIWLLVMLLPTLLTLSAPNFNRMIAAQVPVMFLAAWPMAEAGQFVVRKWGPAGAAGAAAGAVLVLGLVGLATWHDYFIVWPAVPGTRQPLNRNIVSVVRYLQEDPDSRPALISSLHLEDSDPYIVGVSLERSDIALRWADSSQSVVLPAGYDTFRLVVTADRWIDDDLRPFLDISRDTLVSTEDFTAFAVRAPRWPKRGLAPAYYLAPEETWPADGKPHVVDWVSPYYFCGCSPDDAGALSLESLTLDGSRWQPGDTIDIVTTWQVHSQAQSASLASFMHLLDGAGQIVAQQDGLGYPPHSWHAGDRFAQLHRLQLEVPAPGEYWLQLGLYRRETGRRWLVQAAGVPRADRLLFGPITIE